MSVSRRSVVAAGLAAAVASPAAALAAPAVRTGRKPVGSVVVVGAGFGGATAAKYIRMRDPRIEVTVVEPRPRFISCPISNLVLGGVKQMADITLPYGGLARHGIRLVHDEVAALDLDRRQVRLARGPALRYDRLVMAPGIDFQYESIEGLEESADSGRWFHAYKAGPQTVALRQRLEALPDGAVFAMSVPKGPYRCPPGPYERASVIAEYFKQHKPRCKVLVFDANPDLVSKRDLFLAAWKTRHPGIIEYRPNAVPTAFDARAGVLRLGDDSVKADLFNIIPPQQAGRVANPLINVNNQWVAVEFQGWEAIDAPGVHVVGDAIAPSPGMPKSAQMANHHGKMAADAVVARLAGQPVNERTIIANTCYSFVDHQEAMHVATVHKWSDEKKTLLTVPGAGGLSAAPSVVEGVYAMFWAQNIWADTLT